MAYLVLGVKSYNFRQQDTGELISGVKVTYCDEPTYSNDTKGFTPMNITAPLESYTSFTTVPGLYELNFRLKPDQKGKAQLVFGSAQFVDKVEIPLLS